MIVRLTVLFQLISFLLCTAVLHAAAPVDITNDLTEYSLGQYIETLEDPGGTLTLQDILTDKYRTQFRKSKSEIPNFGFTRSTYWVRLLVHNASSSDNRWLLETGFPLLDSIQLYVAEPGNEGIPRLSYTETTGRMVPFSKRKINHRNFIFDIPFPVGKTTEVYLRIKTDDGMIFPISLWDRDLFKITVQQGQLLFGIYYGIVLVMIFYNLFIFFSVRDFSYLFYVLYISAFGFFQLAMNGLAYQHLWPDSPWWAIHANPFFIGLSIFFAVLFSIKFLQTREVAPKVDVLFKILMVCAAILSAASLVVDYSITIVFGQLLPLACIALAIPTAIYCLIKGHRSARFYLIAWSMFFFGVVLSTLRVLGLISHNLITEHGLQIGSGFEMVLLSLALADRINIMKKEKEDAQEMLITTQKRDMDTLQKAKDEIEEANRRISLSEEKYRLLVEGSNDIIFTLDENWRFINANRALLTHLKIKPENAISGSFLDLLFDESTASSVTKHIVQEKLEQLIQTRKPVDFRTQLKSPMTIEPKEMQIRFEYINIEGKNEILGKASSVAEDELLKYFVSENQTFSIGNFLLIAEDITHRLTSNLRKYMEPRDVNLMRLGLREIIINAIEHGNLNISFMEKSEAINENRYFQFVSLRQRDPEYSSKRIHIEYSIDPEKVTYHVQDEGEGFDHHRLLNAHAENNELLSHGRGVIMTRNIFDEVIYNEKGNGVRLIKYFSRN
ncbi:MAG TPA: 7TM diverse intracellular signaling domain-containing protein [Spirochaetota bacterium]|nr:7TM diverse intracellular signaling domain-containing protein [Spirochaetota bacterium]